MKTIESRWDSGKSCDVGVCTVQGFSLEPRLVSGIVNVVEDKNDDAVESSSISVCTLACGMALAECRFGLISAFGV